MKILISTSRRQAEFAAQQLGLAAGEWRVAITMAQIEGVKGGDAILVMPLLDPSLELIAVVEHARVAARLAGGELQVVRT